MREVVICEPVRTPVGRFGGVFKDKTVAELGTAAVAGLLAAGAIGVRVVHAQPAGLGTDTLAGSAYLYLPLRAPMRTRGVLAIKPENRRILLVPEQQRQLDTFAALAAIALLTKKKAYWFAGIFAAIVAISVTASAPARSDPRFPFPATLLLVSKQPVSVATGEIRTNRALVEAHLRPC